MARVSVHSTILQPNDVLYLPAAYLVMEKHVGALSMGLRFSCLHRCAFSHPAFGLADLATLAEGKTIAGPAQQALDVMRASRDALMGKASMMDDYKATFNRHSVMDSLDIENMLEDPALAAAALANDGVGGAVAAPAAPPAAASGGGEAEEAAAAATVAAPAAGPEAAAAAADGEKEHDTKSEAEEGLASGGGEAKDGDGQRAPAAAPAVAADVETGKAAAMEAQAAAATMEAAAKAAAMKAQACSSAVPAAKKRARRR